MSDTVTPFEIHIDDAVIADLHRRLDHTRWPERETVAVRTTTGGRASGA